MSDGEVELAPQVTRSHSTSFGGLAEVQSAIRRGGPDGVTDQSTNLSVHSRTQSFMVGLPLNGDASKQWVVDPHSVGSKYWAFFIAACSMFSILSAFYEFAFVRLAGEDGLAVSWDIAEVVFDAFFLVDIIASFQRGYYAHGRMVTDVPHIRKRYLTTWFVPELIAVLPWGLIGLERAKFTHLIRIRKLADYAWLLESSPSTSTLWIRILKLQLYGFLLIHVVACGWLYLGSREGYGDTPWLPPLTLLSFTYFERYIFGFFWSMALLSRMTLPSIPTTLVENLYTIGVLLVGSIGLLFLIGQFAQVFRDWTDQSIAFKEESSKVNAFLQDQEIPLSLRYRVLEYQRQQLRTLDESEPHAILEMLPKALQTDIQFAMHKRFLRKTRALQKLDPSFIAGIFEFGIKQAVLPGETLCPQGEAATHVHFVLDGELDEVDTSIQEVLRSYQIGDTIGAEHLSIFDGNDTEWKTTVQCSPLPPRCSASVLSIPIEEFESLLDTFSYSASVFKSNVEKENKSTGIERDSTVLTFFPSASRPWFDDLLSPRKWIWDTVISILTIYNCICVPYRIGFVTNAQFDRVSIALLLIFDALSDIGLAIDISVHWKQHVFRYFKWARIVGLLPVDWIGVFYLAATAQLSSSFRLIGFLRLLRLITNFTPGPARWTQGLQHIFLWRLFGIAGAYLWTIHIIAAGYFLFSIQSGQYGGSWLPPQQYEDASPFVRYSFAVFYVLNQLLVLGTRVVPVTLDHALYSILILWVGAFFGSFLIGALSSTIAFPQLGAHEFHNSLDRVQKYLELHHVPKALQTRVWNNLLYYWETAGKMDPNHSIKTLPPILQRDVMIELTGDKLRQHPAFTHLSDVQETQLARSARFMYVPREQFLYHCGDIADCMYFVLQGRVRIHRPDMVQKHHFAVESVRPHETDLRWEEHDVAAGSFCGDECLMQPAAISIRNEAARTIEPCALLFFDKATVLEHLPGLNL